MKDYANSHVGKWYAGEAPRINMILATVAYDQRTNSYTIWADERDTFTEWVADVWTQMHTAAGEIIQREMEAGESAATALEEADIDVRFYPLTDLIKKGL